MVPYWSHDGKWIYYSSPDNVTRQLWKIPAAGGPIVDPTIVVSNVTPTGTSTTPPQYMVPVTAKITQ